MKKDTLPKTNCPSCLWIGNFRGKPLFLCEKVVEGEDGVRLTSGIRPYDKAPTSVERQWAKENAKIYLNEDGSFTKCITQ